MDNGGRKSFRRKLQVSCGIRDYRCECASSLLHENMEQKLAEGDYDCVNKERNGTTREWTSLSAEKWMSQLILAKRKIWTGGKFFAPWQNNSFDTSRITIIDSRWFKENVRIISIEILRWLFRDFDLFF